MLDEEKRIAEAQAKAAEKAQNNDFLIYLVVINRHTGKAEITEFEKNPKTTLDKS